LQNISIEPQAVKDESFEDENIKMGDKPLKATQNDVSHEGGQAKEPKVDQDYTKE